MKAHVAVQLRPFLVPAYVQVISSEDVKSDMAAVPLSMLSGETLASLCDEFRKNVFAKARVMEPQPDAICR